MTLIPGRWRKLPEHEPLHKSRWPLAARALEAYLIKRARDDGFLDHDADRLVLALHPAPTELDATREAIEILLEDGFLAEEQGGIYVRDFIASQEPRRAGAASLEPALDA